MKNVTKHAEKLRSLMGKLFKEKPTAPLTPQDPLKAFVRAAMSFDVPDARADEAMRLISEEFVDLNELRVATELEIQELLGTKYPAIEVRVPMITRGLNFIFEKEHTLSLDRLKGISKREARDFLRTMPDIHPFVEAYVMLFSFEGHAVPVDDAMAAYLRDMDVLVDGMSLEDAHKFLEHQVKAEECYDLYCCRRAAFDESARPKKKK